MWRLKYSKQAQQDSLKLASAGLKGKAEKLLTILAENPYQSPPSFEKLKELQPQSTLVELTFNIGWFIKFLRMDTLSKSCGCERITESDTPTLVKDLLADVRTDLSIDFALSTSEFQLASGETLSFFVGA